VLTIGGLTALAAVLLALLAEPLVARLLGGGRFDEEAVSLTAGLLVAFAITIPIDSLSYPLSRALYATHNTGQSNDQPTTLRSMRQNFGGIQAPLSCETQGLRFRPIRQRRMGLPQVLSRDCVYADRLRVQCSGN